ncbi:MAG: type IV pilus assembly protein PilM [Thermoleophilia bacterium]|nr:type IV pilus assembly protein PilM [Thermoleophilia bacterium]
MASTAWGIDVGEHSIKGVKMVRAGADVRIVAFDRVECAPPQTKEPAEREQRLRDALQTFLARNRVSGRVVVSMPEPAFNRVIPLPPVETKRLDEIVQYEARQRIPFPLDEVTWAYQPLGRASGDEETKVAIFAVQNQRIHAFAALLGQCKLDPDIVQIPSLALLNFVSFDRGTKQCSLVLDLGAARTDLIIMDGASFWTREIRVSGSAITKALMEKFQISYEDAEELKRQGAKSQQADKLFTVIRPILESLVAEVQRSISHFRTQIDKNANIERVLLAGSTSKLVGVKEFLKQNLGVEIAALSEFSQVGVSGAAAAPEFVENIAAYCVAVGLGLQGLGVADINISMLPQSMVVEKTIARKKPLALVGVAVIALLVGFLYWASGQKSAALSTTYAAAKKQYDNVEGLRTQYAKASDMSGLARRCAEVQKATDNSGLWVYILNSINGVITQRDLQGRVWLAKIESRSTETTAPEYEAMLEGRPNPFDATTRGRKEREAAKKITQLDVSVSGETEESTRFVRERVLPFLERVPGFHNVDVSEIETRESSERAPAPLATTRPPVAPLIPTDPMAVAPPPGPATEPVVVPTPTPEPAPIVEAAKKTIFTISWSMRLDQPVPVEPSQDTTAVPAKGGDESS